MNSESVKQVAEKLYEHHYLPIVVKDMNSNTTTTNHQLQQQGKLYFGSHFKGVHRPSNIKLLGNIIKNKGDCCIINTTEAGEHWCAFYRGDNREIAYYDSFARDPDVLFADLAHGEVVPTEKDLEQTDAEKNCGQRCLAYLLLCKDYGSKVSWWV